MSEEKGALILTHLQSEGACTLGETLYERGFRIKTLNVPRIDLSDIDPLRPELLVVMGGPIGVYQKEEFPFLKEEIDILKTRLAQDKPTIGICLGAQLIAEALGSKVHEGSGGREIGWHPLEITEEGLNSPARHFSPELTNMFHWHGDTFDLPKNVTRLASSAQYKNQIFQHEENTLGLQCHPEVGHAQLQEWFVMFTRQITGDNPLVPINVLRAQTDEHIETLNVQSKKFFNEWCEERGL